MAAIGDTFLAKTPSCDTVHLFAIISDIIDNKVLMINVTTNRDGKDQTCIINKGDHPFVKNKSVINYADATEADPKAIDKAMGIAISAHAPLSEKLLKRIQEGCHVSPAFKPKFKKYL